MAGQVTYLTMAKFVAHGVFAREGLEYVVDDFVFIRKDSLEFHKLEEVLNICQKYSKLNLHILVVRSQEHLTIWVEDQKKSFLRQSKKTNSKKAVARDNYSASLEKTIQKYRGREYEKENILLNCSSVPTKKVFRRYRGRAYVEEVTDWSQVQPAKQPTQQPKKFRRKYRGQYID